MEETLTQELNISFQDIIGQEPLKDYFQSIVRTERLANVYLLSGPHDSGKRMIAEAFAAALLCEKNHVEEEMTMSLFEDMEPEKALGYACGECLSCRKFQHRNHPDFIEITHEKPKLISADEVRSQLVAHVDDPPVEGKYRIYLMEHADLMNITAQNAILKSIEEPPKHAVILLLTENPDILLPTIRSRVVSLEMKPVREELIERYLMDHFHLPDYQAKVGAKFSQGNVGQAALLAESQEFQEQRDYVVKLIDRVRKSPEYKIDEEVRSLASKEHKDDIPSILNLMLIWYRDVLLYKATGEDKHIIFRGELSMIQRQAEVESYVHLNHVFEELKETQARLRANMKAETALNLLLLVIKGENP